MRNCVIGNLTKNLSRHEFACRCGCGFDTVDVELAEALQSCVDHFTKELNTNIRIKITGPNRCREYNEKVQKEHNPDYVQYSSKSQHIYARAADFKLFIWRTNEQIDPEKVAVYFETCYQDRFGMGRYINRTHFDTRTIGPARWDTR